MGKRRLYRRKLAAAPFELLAWLFPRSAALRRAADRLSFLRSVYGPYLYNTPLDRTFELCLTGYGSFVAEAIAGLDRDFVFLDIGANLGLFSLLAAQNPRCRQVYAFEPVPRTFRLLEANIRRNAATIVRVSPAAIVGSDDTEAFLSFSPRHSGLSRVIASGPASLRTKAIGAKALEALVASEGRIVAKIDVEGSELAVLETLAATRLYNRIDEIIIEISDKNLGADKKSRLLALLRRDGLREVARAGSLQHYDARYVR